MDISNKELFKQQCFINGEWTNALNKETIDVNNPASEEVIEMFQNVEKMRP